MNNKQAKMLNSMLASKADKKVWKKLTSKQKGKMRMLHKHYDKLARLGFKVALVMTLQSTDPLKGKG